ncbi:MAG: RNA methyltransferase [Myxococcota bacterium]|nr:RNA methyltransferase [Myxococcota bacterium]
MSQPQHPRDTYLTIFGRKPVLEALDDPDLTFGPLRIDQRAKGDLIQQIIKMARKRGIKVTRASSREVNRISRNAKQDQGCVLDVVAPQMMALDAWLETRTQTAQLLLLDGVTTPSNVGMIIRAATAAGLGGIIVPRRGCPAVGPLVIKASAGTAFKAPLLRAERAVDAVLALKNAGFATHGLMGDADQVLYECHAPDDCVWILGNETNGISDAVASHLDRRITIPMAGGVESLNVATAGAIVAFELARRQR